MEKVAIYPRVSSDKQDKDLSISAQIRALRDYTVKNDYEIVREFVDEAESGRTVDRPAFRQMIAQAISPRKPFSKILVWKSSRFARNREDAIIYKSLLRKHGVQVISITESFDDTPTGKMLEGVIECLDEFYSANLGEEIMRGLVESVSRGFYVGGIAPYGYVFIKVADGNKERSKLKPDESTSAVALRIYEYALHGKGLKKTAKILNNEGIISPRNRGWTVSTLYHILTNEAYTGTLVWGKRSKNKKLKVIRVDNAWPAIIDKKTFNKVQEILRERAPAKIHPRTVSSKYLLSGLMRCGNCGKALVGQEAKSGKYAYYVCGTLLKKGAGTCNAKYINSCRFDNLVIEKIKENILIKDNLKELVKLVNKEIAGQSDTCRKNLESIKSELVGVQHRLDNLYEALETKTLDLNDLAPRIKHLKQRQDKLFLTKQDLEDLLANKRVDMVDLQAVINYTADLGQLITESPIEEQKAFIRSFIKKIEVKGESVELIYTLPMPSGETQSEKAGVLDIVRIGSAYRIRTGDLLLEREVS